LNAYPNGGRSEKAPTSRNLPMLAGICTRWHVYKPIYMRKVAGFIGGKVHQFVIYLEW